MDVLRIAADDGELRVEAFLDMGLGERDEHLTLQAVVDLDQSWYRGIVTELHGSPTIEVSILLDDGRAVTVDEEVVAMPPPGGCARGGGQWAGTHGPPRSVPARRVEEDNGTQ